MTGKLLFAIALILLATQAFAQCLNPAYEGYGDTVGGAGRSVVTVSNLGDSGSGSLRNAIGDNRCIQFSVAGEIDLTGGSLSISGASNFTIDGFSAPSPGITLRNCGIYGIGSDTNNFIIRGIRIRMEGSNGDCNTEGDGIQLIEGPHHFVLDHNSVSGALDENLGIAHVVGNAPHDGTVSWNIFADPTQVGGDKVNIVIATGVQRISFHHNITASGTRHPRVGYQDNTGAVSPDVMVDVRNNLAWVDDEGSQYVSGAKANAINNYFIKAPGADTAFYEATAISLQNPGVTQLYTSGNVGSPAISGLNLLGGQGSPFTVPAVTTSSAFEGACDAVGGAGVFPRDAKDQSVTSRVALLGCGTPTCNPGDCDNGCCGSSCCPPTPLGNIAKYACDGDGDDTGALNLGLDATPQGNASFSSVNPIIGTHSLLLDGSGDYMTVPVSAAWNVGPYVCLAGWVRPTGLDTDGGGVIGTGSYRLFLAANGRPAAAYSDGAVFQQIEAVDAIPLNTTHHLGMTVDDTHLRLWVDNVSKAETPRGGDVADPVGFVYIGRRGGGEDTADFQGRLDNVTAFSTFCDNAAMTNLFNEQPPAQGWSSTHWRFYQANAADNIYLPGQPVDSPNIVINRAATLRMGWNIKRNGSTISEHFGLECNLNGGAFVTIDNSCAVNPACIATDSVKNMGDPTTADPQMPNDGFTFVPGRYVVDTINTGLQTTVLNGQVTKWDYNLAYRQTLANADVVSCRPRMATGVFDAYPPVLPTMTISAPPVVGGMSLTGGRFEGGRNQ